jgi:hypothetical protein
MNATELSEWVGKRISVSFGDLAFECLVTDAKSAYGNLRLQIKPASGTGETWIDSSRATELPPKKRAELQDADIDEDCR